MTLDEKTLQQFVNQLGLDISNYPLLEQALTHRSFLGESENSLSNERLEFLGDSVLGVVVAQYLFEKFPERSEGELAKAKAVSVSEPLLAESAQELGLADMILMSSGEESSGGRQRLSILADTFEAVVAVIFLDCGLEAARKFVVGALSQILDDVRRQTHIRDYKTMLQEHTQGTHKKVPIYTVVEESGADHDKTFNVVASLENEILGRGSGKNKKQAEQAAALESLQKLGIVDNGQWTIDN